MNAISAAQLRALQALAARCFAGDTEEEKRAARLAWASQQVGRNVVSFCALNGDEATRLIELLKTSLGQPLTPRRRRPRSRELCQALGTHGRRGHVVEIAVIASPNDLAVIDDLRDQLGWTREQFEAWLRSPSSPLRGRADAWAWDSARRALAIRTLADANKVRWGLQALLRRRRVG